MLGFAYLLDLRPDIGALDRGQGGFEVGIGLAQQPVVEAHEEPESKPEPPPVEDEFEEVLPEPIVDQEIEVTPEPVASPMPIQATTVAEPAVYDGPQLDVMPSLGESEPRSEAPVGRGSTPAFGGDPGVRDVYIARLSARFNRFKYYPVKSLRALEEGITVLALVLNREGKVLSVSIVNSSGFETLDQAALKIVKNAEPMPRFDRRMKMTELRVNIPITFDIARLSER